MKQMPVISKMIFLWMLLASFISWQNLPEKKQKAYPNISALPILDAFPDLFTGLDGQKITTKEEWNGRREELKNLIQYYEYGFPPDRIELLESRELYTDTILKGKVVYHYIRLYWGTNRAIQTSLSLYVPIKAARKAPLPVVVTGDRCWYSQANRLPEFVKRGYILAEFDRTDFDHDDGNRLDGVHPFFPDNDWGTIAAWAWGYSRVIDYLVTLPFISTDKIIVTGHSRGGKTVLLAGALDERIALTVPNGSGTCGTGPLRYHFSGETIDDITSQRNFRYWFGPRFEKFRGEEVRRLPFDQHSLIALIAPRAFLSTNALGDTWANPQGTQKAHAAAKEAWDFLGASDKIAIHFRQGGHWHNDEDWNALFDYADHIFYHKKLKLNYNELPFDPNENPPAPPSKN